MNYKKDLELIYWGTAGCASRSNSHVFSSLSSSPTITYFQDRDYHRDNKEEGGGTGHTQGIPPGCENFKIVCMIRNPYTRAVSNYIDILEQQPKLKFFDFLKTSRFRVENDYSILFWNEWEKIGREPDYFIRLEEPKKDWNKINDIESIDRIIGNDRFNKLLDETFKINNQRGEKPQDKYDSKGHQVTNIYFNQESADFVYEKAFRIFEIGNYPKDSWK